MRSSWAMGLWGQVSAVIPTFGMSAATPPKAKEKTKERGGASAPPCSACLRQVDENDLNVDPVMEERRRIPAAVVIVHDHQEHVVHRLPARERVRGAVPDIEVHRA